VAPPVVSRLHRGLRKVGKVLATAVIPTNLVDVIASEMAAGVDRAVEAGCRRSSRRLRMSI
jgi:hypothetical protein